MEYFGLQVEFHQKVALQLNDIRDNFVTLKILCNLSKVHRVQQGTEERKSNQVESAGTHSTTEEASSGGRYCILLIYKETSL